MTEEGDAQTSAGPVITRRGGSGGQPMSLNEENLPIVVAAQSPLP
jgi:hypothetical protein